MGWDFSLSRSINAMIKTTPFIVTRMVVYFGIALLYIFATGTGGAVGYGVTSFGDGEGAGAFYGALFGFVGASGVLYWLREYILYVVKAGHIAVLTKLYDNEPFPEGKGQVTYAKDVVQAKFKEASIMFAVDQLVKGVLKAVTRLLGGIAWVLPIPGLENLMKLVNSVIRMSLTYVDEIILAHAIRTNSDNMWATAREALVLYGQNYKSFIKNAVWLSLMMWGLTFLIFVVLLAPTFAIMALIPGDLGFWSFIIAFILAWSFKAAIIEPIAMFSLMQVFFEKTEGQVPDPEWEARLEKASDKFRELTKKARDFVPGFGKDKDKPSDGPDTPAPDPA